MAVELSDSEMPIDEDDWQAVDLKLERLEQELNSENENDNEINDNHIVIEPNQNADAEEKPEIDSVKQDELAKICQFLIRLLLDWPGQRIKRMPGKSTMVKILALAKKEGLFKSMTGQIFTSTVRDIVMNEQKLGELVPSEEDKRLILDHLAKLGIGVHILAAKKRVISEPRDSTPNSVEVAETDELIDSNPSNEEIPAEKRQKVKKTGKFCSEKVNSDKKLATAEDELKQMKELLASERDVKMSNLEKIKELSREIDDHQKETIQLQELTHQQQSRIVELENELVRLNCELSKYPENFPES